MEKIANLAQVYFLPVWKKLEGEKQVRFRISALAKMMKFSCSSREKANEGKYQATLFLAPLRHSMQELERHGVVRRSCGALAPAELFPPNFVF